MAYHTTMKITYETETCSRCHGSGHHSRCERYGTTCFKCAGSGQQRTRRAVDSAARVDKFKAATYSKVRAQDLVPGLVAMFREQGRPVRRTVTRVDLRPDLTWESRIGPEGPGQIVNRGWQVMVETNGWGQGMDSQTLVDLAPTVEQWGAVCAYAATLPGVTVTDNPPAPKTDTTTTTDKEA